MTTSLKEAIEQELAISESFILKGNDELAFYHLERAHVLGQTSTFEHTRIHWRMFKLGVRKLSPGEISGQFIRIVGAATKTPFGIYPVGNTGGSNVWFFKSMPVPDDLQQTIDKARIGTK